MFTSQCPDTFIDIENYVCIRNDRSWSNPDTPGQIKKGGGVCLYLNDQLNISPNSFELHNEIQWIEIINTNCKNF